MDDRKNNPQLNTQEDFEIDFSVLLRDLLRSFGKLWWLAVMLAAVFAVAALFYSAKTYQPMYKAETTFTVETYSALLKAAILSSTTALPLLKWL